MDKHFKKLIFLFHSTQHQYLIMAFSLLMTFCILVSPRFCKKVHSWVLSRDDGVNGIGHCKVQNPPQGRLRHLKLLPDGTERHAGPPQLNGGPLGILFEGFPRPFPNHYQLATVLENAEICPLYKWPPNKKFSFKDGDFSCALPPHHAFYREKISGL